jgi:hypothetical protein
VLLDDAEGAIDTWALDGPEHVPDLLAMLADRGEPSRVAGVYAHQP